MDQKIKIPMRTVQNGVFEILRYVRDVCDRNGLTYYLAYGTLLGAVRHQGFIPWDDDVDLHMPREDFMKLLEIVRREPHPYYRLIAKETSATYTRIMAKVIDSRTKLTQSIAEDDGKEPLGLFVDIFLLDGAGNTREEAEETYREAYAIYCLWRRSIKKMFIPGENKTKSFLLWAKHTPERIAGVHYWMKKHDAFCTRKAYADCTYVGAMGAGTQNPARNIWKREWFGEGCEVVFNGEVFRAPVDWDAVLRPEYGEYMQLPPPEKRRSDHPYTLVVPDSVQTEYTQGKPQLAENGGDNDLISIIIPVYNVEKYLDRCVESVLGQSWWNLEILLIDDGSADSSGALCDGWAEKDSRIRVIHKENGGLSDARNVGIEKAKGRYLIFADSDDYLAPDMAQNLYRALKENDADMSICSFAFVDEKGSLIKQKIRKIPMLDEIISGREAMEKAEFLASYYYNVAWNKLYKKELFSELRYPKGKIYEDVFLSHHLLALCKKIVSIPYIGYFYVQRRGSILHSKRRGLHLHKAEAYLDRARFYDRQGVKKGSGRAYLQAGISLSAASHRARKTDEWEEWEETLNSFRHFYRLRKYCVSKDRLKLSIIYQSPLLFHILFQNPVRAKTKAVLEQMKGS